MTPYFQEQLGCEGNMSQHDILALERAQPAASANVLATTKFSRVGGMLETVCPYCEIGFSFEMPLTTIENEQLDQHLDAILKAAGSALRHYTMQKSRDDMRAALRAAIAASGRQG